MTWKKAYYTSVSEHWHSRLLSHDDYTQLALDGLTLEIYHFLCNNDAVISRPMPASGLHLTQLIKAKKDS